MRRPGSGEASRRPWWPVRACSSCTPVCCAIEAAAQRFRSTLRVEHSAGDLLLTWNRESDAIRNARNGVLTIADGDRSENHPMDRSELQNGSIVYSPLTADVSFHLEVTGPDNSKTAAESVRVLRTRPSPMPPETATSVQTGKSGAGAANSSEASAATPGADGDAASAAGARGHQARYRVPTVQCRPSRGTPARGASIGYAGCPRLAAPVGARPPRLPSTLARSYPRRPPYPLRRPVRPARPRLLRRRPANSARRS